MFGLKRLKLFLKSKSIPLERATRYVGVLDVVRKSCFQKIKDFLVLYNVCVFKYFQCLGFTFFAVMLLHINETQSNILKKDQSKL